MASTMTAVGRETIELTLNQVVCFIAAYLLAAVLGQELRIAHSDIAIWWPQSGLFLAVLLVHELRLWSRFAVTAFAAELLIYLWLYHVAISASLVISLVHTLQTLCCGYCVRRWCCPSFRLQSSRGVLGLTVAALLGPALSATLGTATLAVSGAPALRGAWQQWWLGDTAAILLVAPLVLALLQDGTTRCSLSPARWAEAAVLLIALVAAGTLIFSGYSPLAFVVMPLLLWAGLRFGVLAVAAAGTVLSVVAVRSSAAWHGALAAPTIDLETRILLAQACLLFIGISTLLLMAMLSRRQAAQQAWQQGLRRERDALESQVAERTSALQQRESRLAAPVDGGPSVIAGPSPEHLNEITARKQAEAGLRDTNESLQRLSARQDSLLEAERTRIAREIHDDLGAAITGVTMHVQMALTAGADNLLPVRERLVQALQLVDAANQSMHRIINDLRPSVLDHLGIWGGLEWLADQWQARTGLPCELSLDPALTERIVAGDRATALFRIVQESLTNVTRHARATRVDILAQLNGDAVNVIIQDDGIGLAAEHLPAVESMGLLNMHERARRFGGTLQVTGATGRGTQVALRLPLDG
jgi:signal transduction histidine kinase